MVEGDSVNNDDAKQCKKWKDCEDWEDVADGRDMFLCGLVAARTCLAFVAFILFGIMSAGMDGAPYLQSWTQSFAHWQNQCRAVHIKPPVEFQWSIGGGEFASVGASVSASGVDVSATASGANGSTSGLDCTKKNGEQFCWRIGCQKLAKVCCYECNEDEEYNWVSNIRVLDLSRYSREEGGAGDQEGTFEIAPDKINGGWFMLPIFLWFVLRIAGAKAEFIAIWNAKKEFGIISAPTFFGGSIVPGICLRHINQMVAAQSEPGVMFVLADDYQRRTLNATIAPLARCKASQISQCAYSLLAISTMSMAGPCSGKPKF